MPAERPVRAESGHIDHGRHSPRSTSYIDRVEVDNGGWQALTGTGRLELRLGYGSAGGRRTYLPVRATDAVGNVSPVYAINVIVDSTPPQPAFTTGTADAQRPAQDAQGTGASPWRAR
ncbi:MAG: hypothetical protein H6644_02780 [Caldilineaceae bacterium]|nr:hypothetical protein [Caldilineaceae bacterium]